jgi:hypothetical protein
VTPELIRSALGWSTVINMGLFLWWFLFFTLAHDWVYRFHSHWFRLSVERFDATHYQGMAIYKLAILLFNFVPWLALHIVA